MKLKIGGKLMLGGLATLVPVAAAGVFVLHLASTSLEERIFAQRSESRDSLKARVEARVAELEAGNRIMQEDVTALWLAGQRQMQAAQASQTDAIQGYFRGFGAQLGQWSQSELMHSASRELSAGFRSYGEDLKLDAAGEEQARRDMRDYYTGTFGEQYRRVNDGRSTDVSSIAQRIGDTGTLLQAQYIARNRNPLGSKHLLDAAADGTRYSQAHARLHPDLRALGVSAGVYDIFFVDAESGDVFYTMFKEADFATNLKNGPFAGSGLARAFQKALALPNAGDVCMVDFAPYLASYDAPATFMAAPIFEAGKRTSVMIYQLPLDQLNKVTAGGSIGQTGESFMVGPDYLMRSDSRHDKESRSVVASFRNPEKGKVISDATKAVFESKSSGAMVIRDYRGKYALAAYAPVTIWDDLVYANVSKMDLVELLNPTNAEGLAYLSSSVDSRGLDDLLLAAPDGSVLFGVGNGKEVGTNLLSGAFRESGAAKALKQSLETRKIAMTDYAAYEPAGGAICFFSAVPINNGSRTELVVLQRHSINEVNSIFKGTKFGGQTDEAFLVGPDYQMRTDARLDTSNRTVEASFKNPEKGRIKTAITQSAIEEGESGTNYLSDYRQQEVLVAYAPVQFGGTRWALVSKMDSSEAMAGVVAIRNTMLGIGAVCALIVSLFSWLMARGFTKPVTQLATVMGAMASGDLRQKLPETRKDELGDLARSANTMVQGLNEALRGVLHSSDSVARSTTEISRGNQDLASRTDEQASALEETSASLEEISGTVRSNAENTEKARLLANSATQLSAQGSESVTAAIAQMAAIQDSSKRIVEIITTVNDIAFQTNLLALNAAVEAARAGDQGRGFAVVATEVRNQAQRSSQAAKEIQDLIKDSVGKIETGTATVNESGKILQEISKGINEVTQLVTEVSAAAKEQASAIQEINTALTQMDQVTQQNAELVQNAARNSSGLNSQVQDLRELVSRFQLAGGEEGESKAPAREQGRSEPAAKPRNRLAEADAETTVREPAKAAGKPAREPAKAAAEVSGNGKADSLDDWEDIN